VAESAFVAPSLSKPPWGETPSAEAPPGQTVPAGAWTTLAATLRRDVRAGLRSGRHTFWILARAMIPAYLLALVLQQVGVIDWLARTAGPVMSLLGLRGDAAVPLVLA
jgi:Fe2+ transport system protein B